MLSVGLILFVIAVIAGILGFGIANVVNHIAKFLFYMIVIFLLILLFYGYASLRFSKQEPISPETKTPGSELQTSEETSENDFTIL